MVDNIVILQGDNSFLSCTLGRRYEQQHLQINCRTSHVTQFHKKLTQHICVIELRYLGNISISNKG